MNIFIRDSHVLQRERPSINGVSTASEDGSEPVKDYSLLGVQLEDLPLWQIQAEEPLLQGRDQVNCDSTNNAYSKQNGEYLTKFLFTLSKEGEEQIINQYEASNKENKMSTQATPDEEFGGQLRSRVRRHSKKKKGGYGMGTMVYQAMPQVIHVNLQISHAPSCGCGCGGCYRPPPPPPPPPQPCGCGCGGFDDSRKLFRETHACLSKHSSSLPQALSGYRDVRELIVSLDDVRLQKGE
ncbi:unnamed protein product [Timema podura]|uniref:Uncharacterized protein n=1 Tax=Timema podura TaxID=61482 RepID=A0ABN7NQ05_TIMPD|nr:unnamed protein product [Timema podura]